MSERGSRGEGQLQINSHYSDSNQENKRFDRPWWEGDDYDGDQSTTTTETPVLEHSQQDVSSQDCRDPNQDSLHAHEDELESPPTKNLHKSVKNKQAEQPVKGKGKISAELKVKMDEEKSLKCECDVTETIVFISLIYLATCFPLIFFCHGCD